MLLLPVLQESHLQRSTLQRTQSAQRALCRTLRCVVRDIDKTGKKVAASYAAETIMVRHMCMFV